MPKACLMLVWGGAFFFFSAPGSAAGAGLPPSPIITSLSAYSADAGDTIQIYGKYFLGGVSQIKFNGTAADAFYVDSDTEITATIASGTTTGDISLVGKPGTNPVVFSKLLTILPPRNITFIQPPIWEEGVEVMIQADGADGATDVQFNGVSSPSFTVSLRVSPSGHAYYSIAAVFPQNGTSGEITVYTRAGMGRSAHPLLAGCSQSLSGNEVSGSGIAEGNIAKFYGTPYLSLSHLFFASTSPCAPVMNHLFMEKSGVVRLDVIGTSQLKLPSSTTAGTVFSFTGKPGTLSYTMYQDQAPNSQYDNASAQAYYQPWPVSTTATHNVLRLTAPLGN